MFEVSQKSWLDLQFSLIWCLIITQFKEKLIPRLEEVFFNCIYIVANETYPLFRDFLKKKPREVKTPSTQLQFIWKPAWVTVVPPLQGGGPAPCCSPHRTLWAPEGAVAAPTAHSHRPRYASSSWCCWGTWLWASPAWCCASSRASLMSSRRRPSEVSCYAAEQVDGY